MEITYQISYIEEVVKKHIPKLPTTIRAIIKRAIEERLMVDPIRLGKPLRYSLKGHRRLRVGDYRIVYRINAETKTVVVIAILHRKDIYDSLS
jgi:mRNA interferase RelE/StbE